ncbi:MAG: hypothetical protein PHN78_08680 [Dehalococcoidales bacterium]|nr:hypothetical protein [Dehalococcoidales bacterium]
MLEIRKTVVSLDEKDLIELERIITDSDKEEALRFLKKSIYDSISRSQQGKLKSHLDAGITGNARETVGGLKFPPEQ